MKLPLGPLTALPAALPGVRGLAQIIESLRILPELNERLASISEDTKRLPTIEAEIANVARGTAVLPEMIEHTEQIAKTMPVLVQLQEAIPTMVPVLGELTALMGPLQHSITQLERSAKTLADVTEPLQGAAERFGRMADRLPRRRERD
jgi:hypothetical protein